MAFAVVVMRKGFEAMGALFPDTACRVSGGGFVYRLYSVPSMESSEVYRDPFEGTILTATYYFRSRAEADRWVEQDVARQGVTAR